MLADDGLKHAERLFEKLFTK
ncbi:hypothetical protein [Pseudoalteromonas arctica]